MLSMKTLRVAIVTMGSALLLGPGLASAIDLDGTGMNAPNPVLIAAQTISAEADVMATGSTTATHHAVNIGDVDLEISPGILLESTDRYYLRVELGGGLIFDASPTGAGTLVTGGAGSNIFVTRLDANVAADAKITVEVNEALAVPNNAAASYTASMTVHNEQFDAVDGVAALRNIGAENVVVLRTVSGIVSSVTSKTATADVGVGFLWFVNPDSAAARVPETRNVSGLALGSASAIANAEAEVVNAATGVTVGNTDLIDGTAGVRITVSGDYSVGALDIRSLADSDNDGTPDATCPARVGTAETPGMGGLQPSEDEPGMAMTGWMAPGSYGLCLEVDVAGAMSNATPIPETDYMATVHTRLNATATPTVASEGMIGKIERNGASVEIGYLTVSEKHNQRLVIVNRGNNPVSILDIQFQAEPGIEVELSAAAMAVQGTEAAMIQPGDRAVYPINGMLSISGMNALGHEVKRTAATLSFNATADSLTVATVHVNKEDSSTDTVMWPVK